MFQKANFSGSNKTLSIPVSEIRPQQLSKTMTATQGTSHTWSVTKTPTPSTVDMGDTCVPGDFASAPVQIKVEWVRLPATPSGIVKIGTKIYATNPAARTITVNVTDKIYSGQDQNHLLATASATKDVPAGSEQFLLLEHTFDWTNLSGATWVNDVATATYTDKAANVPVPGQTTATASAEIQTDGPVANATAEITDTESITGAGLSRGGHSQFGVIRRLYGRHQSLLARWCGNPEQ